MRWRKRRGESKRGRGRGESGGSRRGKQREVRRREREIMADIEAVCLDLPDEPKRI